MIPVAPNFTPLLNNAQRQEKISVCLGLLLKKRIWKTFPDLPLVFHKGGQGQEGDPMSLISTSQEKGKGIIISSNKIRVLTTKPS